MSAIAFSISTDKIVLLSDGAGTNIHDPKVKRTGSSKILLVNKRVGMLWAGIASDDLATAMINTVQRDGGRTPKSVAKCVSQNIQKLAEVTPLGEILTQYRLLIWILGFDRFRNPRMFTVDNSDGGIKPIDERYNVNEINVKPGTNGEFVYNGKPPIHYNDVLGKYLATHSFETACKKAFEEVVNAAKATGAPVGGEIFTETITA